jgi:two-component system LytT family response regulator
MSAPTQVRAYIVDDELPARKKILRFLDRDASVAVVGEAANGADAVQGIQLTKPDLVFLDVQMSGMSGFEVARALEEPSAPQIVFVTAYEEYALQAFEVHAIGYLLKPFDMGRFEKVLQNAKEQCRRCGAARFNDDLRQCLAAVQNRGHVAPRLLVWENGRASLLPLDEMDWAECDRNYLIIHLGNHSYTVRGTIESLEKKVGGSRFIRINRSSLVRIDFIQELQPWSHGEYLVVLKSGNTLNWTRRFINHPELLRRL